MQHLATSRHVVLGECMRNWQTAGCADPGRTLPTSPRGPEACPRHQAPPWRWSQPLQRRRQQRRGASCRRRMRLRVASQLACSRAWGVQPQAPPLSRRRVGDAAGAPSGPAVCSAVSASPPCPEHPLAPACSCGRVPGCVHCCAGCARCAARHGVCRQLACSSWRGGVHLG